MAGAWHGVGPRLGPLPPPTGTLRGAECAGTTPGRRAPNALGVPGGGFGILAGWFFQEKPASVHHRGGGPLGKTTGSHQRCP